MDDKIVYLMRGLPCCGKSYRAKELAGDKGVVLETDSYFYTEVGDDPHSYDYDQKLLTKAREWNYERFKQEVTKGSATIVVDRGNSLSLESQRYILFAIEHGYSVKMAEPSSPWWQEIRVLLKYKKYTLPVLYRWAEKLSGKSMEHHRVPASFIRRLIDHWKWNVTVEDIKNFNPKPKEEDKNSKAG